MTETARMLSIPRTQSDAPFPIVVTLIASQSSNKSYDCDYRVQERSSRQCRLAEEHSPVGIWFLAQSRPSTKGAPDSGAIKHHASNGKYSMEKFWLKILENDKFSQLDDPTAPNIYRTSGAPPYPSPSDPQIPPSITARQVTLRDRVTIASLIPFSNPDDVPPSLLSYLCSQLNREIEKGDTYPMILPMPLTTFGPYWFQNFAAIMVLGEVHSIAEVVRLENQGADWGVLCLGSFYVKPNYPGMTIRSSNGPRLMTYAIGRSSHVCNGGFLVTEAARNRGVGRLMGEGRS